MNNDIAIFLDLDNLVIGAVEANLTFDIDLVLAHISSLIEGRIVLRRAYGDWRQRATMTKELASAGFELQSTVRLTSNSKNLADMQMVVDAMSTLIDRQNFNTYVLITGDRDFAPLVQALRKRGKQVIGLGIGHATSKHLAQLCDQYVYYDELATEARQMLDDQMEDLLQRALDQLLLEEKRVPASLLKQRLQSLSRGAFGRSPQGKRSFHKLLAGYPHVVHLQQEGTTLYVRRPGKDDSAEIEGVRHRRLLADDEVEALLRASLSELLQSESHVRASLLKQRMQELSDGAFDETLQGDKNFRKFLDRYLDIVKIEQEGSTLYVNHATPLDVESTDSIGRRLSAEDTETLLATALDELLVDQSRVRASLLKQQMQELSSGAFDETKQGFESFRAFLEGYPNLIQIQQKGTTLLVYRPDDYISQEEVYLYYRSILKKQGLRVVPSTIRLTVLKDLIAFLRLQPKTEWRQIVDRLAVYYEDSDREEVSKSFINDVLRIARRAEVIDVGNGGSLAKAAVSLSISGDRAFQNAVIRCDVTYLREIESVQNPLDIKEAAKALYEDEEHARYLKVIFSRYTENRQAVG
ncbi:MAG TPA: NYN domain-containing protein [candidate division Zixibacteria bacterium]|nr:NYN domain-containing protein [candidate division Zixibacteria bacterium]